MRLLTLLALLLAPLGMLGGAAEAMTRRADAGPAMEPCAGLWQGDGKSDGRTDGHPGQRHDCMAACAAIPPPGCEIVAGPQAAAAATTPIPLPIFAHGLGPEAATPPPRPV